MKSSILAILLISAFAFSAHAEEATPVKPAEASKSKGPSDIDEEITNAKLRAESGSKSKFSGSAAIDYRGGAISSPFAANRPNLARVPGVQTESSINGALNGRFRMDKHNSFTAGTTYAIMTPFQGDVTPRKRQFNIIDPTIGYNHVEKLGAFQTVANLGYAYGTSHESVEIDLTHQPWAHYTAIHDFGNGLTAGASVWLGYHAYSSKPGTLPKASRKGYGGDRRVDWHFSFYPQAEYRFSERYSVRTVFGYFNWKHLYGDSNRFRLLQKYVYQSVGVGIAVSRDVYVYPNVQFVPDHIASNFTNFAVATTINIF